MRGVAIAVVVAFHWFSQYVPYFTGGYVGVDVFFVLSGFIITRILWRRPPSRTLATDYGQFLRARFRRLYPALIALLAVGILLESIIGIPVSGSEATRNGAWVLAQAGSLLLGLRLNDTSPFSQTWSLSVEWIFYLFWPLVLMRCRRRLVSPERLALGCVGAAAALFMLSLCTSPHWFYFGPTSRSAQLLAGCAFSLWAVSTRFRQFPAPVVDAAAALVLLFITTWTLVGPGTFADAYRGFAFPAVTVGSVILCAVPLVARESNVRQLLSWQPLAGLGRISYSLYLFHLLAVEVLDKDRISWPTWLLGVTGVGGTIVLTLASYFALERPFTSTRTEALVDAAATNPEQGEPWKT